MRIVNPTPTTPGQFDRYWLSHGQVFRKTGMTQGTLLPYDGTHLLATGDKHPEIGSRFSPAAFATLDAAITALTGKAEQAELVQVFAPDPAKPVMVQVIWPQSTNLVPHRIMDAFALADTDPQFAQALGVVLAEFARLAGLTFEA